MKKTKRETKPVAAVEPRSIAWAPWAAALAALMVLYEIYSPSINAPFVLDDRYLPYFSAHVSNRFSDWVGLLRPLLMLSYWIDYSIAGGSDPFVFHATNIAIHFLASAVVVFVMLKLLEWAGLERPQRIALAIICGAIFLVHPLQVEAVAYTSGRSDALSTLFYYAAFAAFLWRRNEAIGWVDAIAVLVLFGAAIASKENTLTLPALLLLTDYFWSRGSLSKNRNLYGLMAAAAAIGAKMVWGVIRNQQTAGFHTEGLTPAMFFFTECRVIWTYIRMFFLPFGQNVDPDIPLSQSIMDHGAIFGLIGLIALVAAAWIYRKRFPLASFGVFVFLLLISPTSSIVPIKDVMSERRVYLPMIGLLLICCEALRRTEWKQAAKIGAAVVLLFSILTYQRAAVWAGPLTLWSDAVAKSPNKYRAQFQLAYAQFERQQCAAAAATYEKASHLQTPDNELLTNWALALDCMGREDDAIAKLTQALQFGSTAHLHSEIARIHMRKKEWQQALAELATAQQLDPNYEMTYVYRASIYQMARDRQAALREIQHALQLNPNNPVAQQVMAGLGQ